MTDSTTQSKEHERVMSWYDWTDEQAARIAAADGNFESVCYSLYEWSYDQILSENGLTPANIRSSPQINEQAEVIIADLEDQYKEYNNIN